MIYADTDFFLALFKKDDRLKGNAARVLNEFKGQITTSEPTFIELAFMAKRYNMNLTRLVSDVMEICGISDTTYLKAAYFIEQGVGVVDAFQAAHSEKQIISSDAVYDELGLERIKL